MTFVNEFQRQVTKKSLLVSGRQTEQIKKNKMKNIMEFLNASVRTKMPSSDFMPHDQMHWLF